LTKEARFTWNPFRVSANCSRYLEMLHFRDLL